jgi:hypothetical protein
MEKPRVTDLAASAGISKTYASDILATKQPPSRPLAIHIFRTTGWRHPLIADLSDEQLAMLESIEPWKPVADRPTPETPARSGIAA